MADSVVARTVYQDDHRIIRHLAGHSDGTGESDVVKVDKSALTASDGAEPAALDIEWVRWNVQGHKAVKLEWDHTTDDLAMMLAGSGYEDFQGPGIPKIHGGVSDADPRSSGATGDLLLSTVAPVADGSYDITICLMKQPD